MTDESLTRVLLIAIAQWVVLAEAPPISAETRLVEDLGLDSISLVGVADTVEQKLGSIDVDDGELANVVTVGDLQRTLERGLRREVQK